MSSDVSKRVQTLRLREGTAVKALQRDLDLSAASDAPDEETNGLLSVGQFTDQLSYQDRERLRAVVRKVHLSHYPGHMITNLECDRVIAAMGPITKEKLIRKAVEHGVGS